MKEKASRVSLIVCSLIYIASFLALCTPPGCIPLFILMALAALVPIAFGARFYRVLGIVALILAVVSGINEYYRGKRFNARFQEIIQKGDKTNNVAR